MLHQLIGTTCPIMPRVAVLVVRMTEALLLAHSVSVESSIHATCQSSDSPQSAALFPAHLLLLNLQYIKVSGERESHFRLSPVHRRFKASLSKPEFFKAFESILRAFGSEIPHKLLVC